LRTVKDTTIDLFRGYGLTTWFGNPGSSELTLLQDFPHDFAYYLGLQEMVPVGMADGYAQVTGRPVMVNLHTAPGLGNAMGALYNAAWNKTPLIVTAGNQRRIMQNQQSLLTNIDATVVPRPFVKWAAEPAIASEVPAVLAHAIHLALTPPTGPVFVSLPMDDMAVELNEAQVAEIATLQARRVSVGGAPSTAYLLEIADQINSADAPAIVVGGEVERTGAREAVVALAERAGAEVWSAPLPGLSGFPENHPQYRGGLTPGARWISDTLAGHDLIVVLGAPAFRYYPLIPGPYLPEGSRLLHITGDPDEAARAPVGDALIADIRSTAEALLEHVAPGRRAIPSPRPEPPVPEPAEAPLTPAALFGSLAKVAPSDTRWISEAASNEFVIPEYIRPNGRIGHISAAGGGLGFGLPAAVGAQLAEPDVPVVALIGDGSMHYAITALWSAANYNIPVTIVVASNAEYGILKEFGAIEHTTGVPGLDLPGLDIVATASSYGVPSEEAKDTDELEALFRDALVDRGRPHLINVRITKVSA
jgi:thiamine pyrophosphate-dependent acetolactate synthase large subunit-like protein